MTMTLEPGAGVVDGEMITAAGYFHEIFIRTNNFRVCAITKNLNIRKLSETN